MTGLQLDDLKVTKIEAARRQLETASLLFLNEVDILSVHTLAAAAHGVLEDLSAAANQRTILHQGLLGFLPEDIVAQIRKHMRGPQNFLKHADRDPEAFLDFSPRLTQALMFDGMATFAQLTGEQPPLVEAFAMWFAIQHPEFYTGAPREVQAMLSEGQRAFGQLGRRSFLALFLAQKARLLR